MTKDQIVDYVKAVVGRELTFPEEFNLKDMLDEFAKDQRRKGREQASKSCSTYGSSDSWEFNGGL